MFVRHDMEWLNWIIMFSSKHRSCWHNLQIWNVEMQNVNKWTGELPWTCASLWNVHVVIHWLQQCSRIQWVTFGFSSSWSWDRKKQQDCFLQKEARVCVSYAIVIEDSKFKWFFFCCGRWASDRGSRCANVNIVVEWKGILAEGTVVWND